MVRVRNIKALIDVGLTLDDVRAFECCLDGDVASARPAQSKLDLAAARLQVLQRRRDGLVAACSRLEQALTIAQSAIES